jgi:iron uptake system component EfeO
LGAISDGEYDVGIRKTPTIRSRVTASVAISLLGAAVLVVVVMTHPWTARTQPTGAAEVTVSTSACGQGWTAARSGRQTVTLHNTGRLTAEVQLVEVGSGKVYGEVDGLGPNTSEPMTVQLGSGDYAFRCLLEDVDAITGPTQAVRGDEPGGPASVPVTQNDLLPVVKRYESDVAAGIGELVAKTDRLRADVAAGDLGAARTDWLPAHLAFARLGAAYGAFGDATDAIDGTDSGFHPLERGLWSGAPASALRPVADELATDVHGLQATFAAAQVDPNDLGLRGHEIMEDALQFELTGETDQGSGTSLDTALADLDGTAEVLAVLEPVLQPRYPDLPSVTQWSDRVRALLSAHLGTPPGRLDTRTREQLDGAVGELLERLAPIATICEVRRTT